MTLSEYWVILIWSDVLGEFCEQHQDYPTEQKAIEALSTLECKGFYKIEKQYQIT